MRYEFDLSVDPPPTLTMILEVRKFTKFRDGRVDDSKNIQKIGINESIFIGTHRYDFNAIIVHHGESVSHGHFSMFLKSGSSWFHFNDNILQEVVDQSRFYSEIAGGIGFTGYIVFYRRNVFLS